MPWDKYDMATIQSLITSCESLEKELKAARTVADSLKKRVDELSAEQNVSDKRRHEIAQILEDEGHRVPREIMQKLWKINGDPIGEAMGEAMDKACEEQAVYSTTDLYGVTLGDGIW